MPWPDGPVLALNNSVSPAISAWPGSPSRRRRVSRSAGAAPSARRRGRRTARRRPARARAERVVEDGERRVHRGNGVPGRQHEPVREPQPRPADVPAHRPREHQREEHVHLGPGPAGVPALAVVEREVQALVDDVADDLPAREVGLGGGEEALGLGRILASPPARSSDARPGGDQRLDDRPDPPQRLDEVLPRVRVREPDVVRPHRSRTPSRPGPTRPPPAAAAPPARPGQARPRDLREDVEGALRPQAPDPGIALRPSTTRSRRAGTPPPSRPRRPAGR